jgi:hypothetical protein
MSSELADAIRNAESKRKTLAQRARQLNGSVEADRVERDSELWGFEAEFLKTLQAIYETQKGVGLPYYNFPVKQTGTGKFRKWEFSSTRRDFLYKGEPLESEGSFCNGTARAMALRATFGADKPSNKDILTELRDRILLAKQSKNLQAEAEAIIDRIVTHVSNPFAITRYNQQLESRYGIKNVKLRSESQEDALRALNAGAPIIADLKPNGWHWIMVQKSPRGEIWGLDPLSSGGVYRIRLSQLGGRFEIIVDAGTDKPIEPSTAEKYEK